MMRLEYQNHGRVGCLTVDTFGYPPSLHRQSHYIVGQSQHTPHSQHRRYSNNITKIDALWRLLFTKYTFRQLPLLSCGREFSVLKSNRTDSSVDPLDWVSCCLLVTAQLVGRISNIFSFIIIRLRPLHLPSDSWRCPPPPSHNESDQDQFSLPAEDFKRQHRDLAFIVLMVSRVPPVNNWQGWLGGLAVFFKQSISL